MGSVSLCAAFIQAIGDVGTVQMHSGGETRNRYNIAADCITAG